MFLTGTRSDTNTVPPPRLPARIEFPESDVGERLPIVAQYSALLPVRPQHVPHSLAATHGLARHGGQGGEEPDVLGAGEGRSDTGRCLSLIKDR